MLEGARGGGEGAVFGEGGVGACGLDGDVADDFDVFAECDVAVDGEGFAVEEGGCAIGEAGGEVGPEFVVAGIEFDGGRFAVAARVEEEACVVAQGIGIGPEGEEVVGRLDGRKAGARDFDDLRAGQYGEGAAHGGFELEDGR